LDFSSDIRSDLIFNQTDQLSDRILFPIGFLVGFLATFRSDPIVFEHNFRSEILSEIWAGSLLKHDLYPVNKYRSPFLYNIFIPDSSRSIFLGNNFLPPPLEFIVPRSMITSVALQASLFIDKRRVKSSNAPRISLLQAMPSESVLSS